jgi:c-di-GMP-binding flagellar brake protein YcgR
MNFSDLRLPAGTVLQLQFVDDSGERSPAKLLGFLDGRTIMVTQPQKAGQPIHVVKGQRVIVRSITSSAAIAFQSVIEKVCNLPYAYLHLEYPKEVSVNRVRTSPRIATVLEAKATNQAAAPEGVDLAARILDVSPTGARVELPANSVKIGDDITLSSIFNFSDVDRNVTLNCVIRARMGTDDPSADPTKPVVYGIEFQELNEEMNLFLHAYVYREMLEGGA